MTGRVKEFKPHEGETWEKDYEKPIKSNIDKCIKLSKEYLETKRPGKIDELKQTIEEVYSKVSEAKQYLKFKLEKKAKQPKHDTRQAFLTKEIERMRQDVKLPGLWGQIDEDKRYEDLARRHYKPSSPKEKDTALPHSTVQKKLG